MLSPTEKGIYIDLLSFYYSVERPITKEECRRIARAYADEDAQAMQYVLQTHFIDDGEVYRHEKCEKVIADAKALIEKKRKASQVRWNKARSESRTNLVEQNSFNKDSLEHSDEDARAYADEDASGNANGMLTINHKPINISTDVDIKEKYKKEKVQAKKSKATVDKPDGVSEQVWNDYLLNRKDKGA